MVFDLATKTLLQTSLETLPSIYMEMSLGNDIDDIIAQELPASRPLIVCDNNTHDAFGKIVFAACKKFKAELHCFDLPLSADRYAVEIIKHKAADCNAIIAVGAGTINDLCKVASHELAISYICIATAASMNGYCSANASIADDGHKKTIAAHLPKAVLCDLSVISGVHSRLAQSGFGDSVARVTAQADWLLSHYMLGTQYNTAPFSILENYEPLLFDQAKAIAKQEPEAIKTLMQVLLLSGLGMTIASGSYPASQSEHMIAHALDLLQPDDDILHGEAIAVTSLLSSRLQNALLKKNPVLHSASYPEAVMQKTYGGANTDMHAMYQKKAQQIDTNYNEQQWDAAREAIMPISMTTEKMQQLLERAGCRVHAAQLGFDEALVDNVLATARFTRDRFTCLDFSSG